MARAAKPKDIISIEKAALAIKARAPNVGLDLETGTFFVRDSKGHAVKTFQPAKGSDAAYVINKTTRPEDLQAAGQYMLQQRTEIAKEASQFETLFTEKQETLLQTIEMWRGATPGASRDTLSLQIGRIQMELANLEKTLRDKQYKYRESLEVFDIKRRMYIPASNDERVVPHPVYKLNATQTSVKHRVLPIKDAEVS